MGKLLGMNNSILDIKKKNNDLENKVTQIDNKIIEIDTNLTETNTKIEELETSFSTAASEIGDAIVALGVDVPEGTDLHNMASIIESQLYKRNITQSLSGSVNIGYNSQMGGVNTQVVTFSTPFQGVPTVSVSATGFAYGGSASAINITTNGFTIRITGEWPNVATFTATVSWTAVYNRS